MIRNVYIKQNCRYCFPPSILVLQPQRPRDPKRKSRLIGRARLVRRRAIIAETNAQRCYSLVVGSPRSDEMYGEKQYFSFNNYIYIFLSLKPVWMCLKVSRSCFLMSFNDKKCVHKTELQILFSALYNCITKTTSWGPVRGKSRRITGGTRSPYMPY